MNKIIQIHNERETIYDNIIEVLKNEMVEQSKDIKNRPGKMAPDKPYVNLENYNSAISSIKAKGFVELRCQNMGLEINHKKPYLPATGLTQGHKLTDRFNHPEIPDSWIEF